MTKIQENLIAVAVAIVLCFGLSAMSGCGVAQQGEAAMTGYANVCVDGVNYIQFRNGASVKYNVDGSIQTC